MRRGAQGRPLHAGPAALLEAEARQGRHRQGRQGMRLLAAFLAGYVAGIAISVAAFVAGAMDGKDEDGKDDKRSSTLNVNNLINRRRK